MRVLPQLGTGAAGQFPLRKLRTARTASNESSGGSQYKLADDAGASIEWRLAFTAMNDGERDLLTHFFEAMEGRLTDFTFLDPADNLLCWSEQLDNAIWQRNALLQVTGGIGDPFGTQRAWRLTNTSGAALRIEQNLNVPGWFTYALSLYARSAGPEQPGLLRATQTLTQLETRSTGPSWSRYTLSGGFSSTEESVRFGLEIGAGRSIDVFGLQAEAQPTASQYKKTTARCGVYSTARFGDDDLTVTSDGPNRHSCELRVVSQG
jgi:hypothetical protein